MISLTLQSQIRRIRELTFARTFQSQPFFLFLFYVEFSENGFSTAATYPRISRIKKLQKVLRELQIDDLSNSTPHKQPLISFVIKYLDIFAKDEADVGTTSLALDKIDTADVRFLRQPVCPMQYGEVREAVVFEIAKLTTIGIACATTSPWASLVIIVCKKDNSWRMCVDIRRLNLLTKFDSFP